MNIGEALDHFGSRIDQKGILDSMLEAEVLLRHVLEVDRARLFACLFDQLSREHTERLNLLVDRRLDREPLAYIIGHREFYGLDICVNPSVLIPRQETELLVEKALDFVGRRKCRSPIVIADVCTGSGAIAVALAHTIPDAVVYATDLSDEALNVADINRRKHHVEDRVHLRQGDLLEALPCPVDLIVANPPYISSDAIEHLAPEVRREPVHALDGGPDGLVLTGRLIREAGAYLNPGGAMFIEISPEQCGSARDMLTQRFSDGTTSVYRDLLGLPRVVSARLTRSVVSMNAE